MPLFTKLSFPKVSKPNSKPDASTQKEKAQLRRAQVRRAQIQHRQRKANYIKQLELDVSELRDLLSLTEKETAALFKENFLIREALENAGVSSSGAVKSPEQALEQMALEPQEESPELFGDIDIDDLTVTLSVDSALGGPCFYISSNSGSSVSETPTRMIGGVALTWEQEQRAVNFILGCVSFLHSSLV